MIIVVELVNTRKDRFHILQNLTDSPGCFLFFVPPVSIEIDQRTSQLADGCTKIEHKPRYL